MPDSSLTTRNDLQHILQLAKPSMLSKKIVQNRMGWEHKSNALQLVDVTGTILLYMTASQCLLPAHSCKLRTWLNLGKQEVYKREKSEQSCSCSYFPLCFPVPWKILENYVCFVYSRGFRCLIVELWNDMHLLPKRTEQHLGDPKVAQYDPEKFKKQQWFGGIKSWSLRLIYTQFSI